MYERQMQKNYYSLSTANRAHTSLRGASAVLVTLLYALFVLGAATAGSYRLYQWARLAIVDAYNFPSILTSPVVQTDPVDEQVNTAPGVVAVPAQTSGEQRTVTALAPVNILLLGMDSRPGELEPARTDTMILLALDPQSSTAGMLSIPRDLWVNIPGYNTATKINMAYTVLKVAYESFDKLSEAN